MEEETILEEAARLTSKDRQSSYGHPREDFSRQAKMLTGLLQGYLKDGVEIPTEVIPRIMICVKLSRLMHAPKRDSLVDICGYANCEWMLHE